jgi:hypothetical protein
MDLFATADNSYAQVYCSWHLDPDAYGIDALSMPWNSVLNYAFPPLALVQKVILKTRQDLAGLIG